MTAKKLLVGPIGRFMYSYFRTGSFTKGTKGLIYSILNFIYDINVCIILWELTNKLTFEDAVKKNEDRKKQILISGIY